LLCVITNDFNLFDAILTVSNLPAPCMKFFVIGCRGFYSDIEWNVAKFYRTNSHCVWQCGGCYTWDLSYLFRYAGGL